MTDFGEHGGNTGVPERNRASVLRLMLSGGFQAWALGLLALLFGLALTAWISHQEWGREYSERERALSVTARDVESALRSELAACEMLLRSMQSVYLASRDVGDDEFQAAFEGLQALSNLGSLQALSLAARVERVDGVHYVITVVQPERASNAHMIGLDVNTQPQSLRAIDLSRDLNQAVMSAPLRLQQAPITASDTSGVVMRLPAFSRGAVPQTIRERRERMLGSLGASFMVQQLVADALSDGIGEDMAIGVFDVTDGQRIALYGKAPATVPMNAQRTHKEIEFGQRVWRLELVDLRPVQAWPSWAQVLLFGALSSLLFGALVWSMVGTRGRAVALADVMSERFRTSEQRFRRLNELLPTLVMLYDASTGMISYANQAARRRMGIPDEGILLDEVAPHSIARQLRDAQPDQPVAFQEQLKAADGHDFWASIVASQVEIEGRTKWLMVASDVSEQRRLTERLSYQASHDALTGLPNRQEFEARLRRALASHQSGRMALLFIDLDQFKLINDTSGHIAGDQLLVQLAMAMRDQLREEDVLARLGGDEFGVLLLDVVDRDAAVRVAERLRLAIDGYAFVWERRSYISSASIGGTMIEGRGESMKELLAQVDTACYTAKDAGRNRVHFYSDDDTATLRRRGEMDWVNRIRLALDESRMVLAYQEFKHIGDKPDGGGPRVELLLRLVDEEGRQVLPGAFLPAAERYGLMPRIDRWVIDTALANFDHLHPAGDQLAMCSINLSASTLDEEGFTDFVLAAFDRHSVDPRRVMFEITETTAVRDLGQVSRLVAELRAIGCRIALDDFGAGMSSFGYLKTLGIDTIKIDGAFVLDIESDAVSHSIVRAVTEIGHQHGLDVIAEWVANAQQVEVLAKIGVDYAQGFGIHPPELALFQR